jgi:predicted metal-dependent phosphoesterase TrpH
MIIDLHCHSKYSNDNHIEPEEAIERAIKLGLDGICFTEHHSYESSAPIDLIVVPEGFVVFRGVEVSTDMGHLLVYGVEDDSWNTWGKVFDLKFAKVIESVHERGGICVPAHPFRGRESLGDAVFTIDHIDGVETHNGTNKPEQNKPAHEAALKLGLTSIGGSDAHYLQRVGRAVTEFGAPVSTMKELVEEIKTGNCEGRYY